MLLTWLLLLYIWHGLMYYITQKQNGALCGQSLSCTENVYIIQYKLRCWQDHSLKLRWGDSHAQVIGYSCSAALQGHAKLCRRGERRLTTLRPYCCRATAANWLIDVIEGVQCLREALLIFPYELLCEFFKWNSILFLHWYTASLDLSFFLGLYTAVTPHTKVHRRAAACGRLHNYCLLHASKSPLLVVRRGG